MAIFTVAVWWCQPASSQTLASGSSALPSFAATPAGPTKTVADPNIPQQRTSSHAVALAMTVVALLAIVALFLFYSWHRRQLAREKTRSEHLENQLLLARLTLDTVPLNIFWYGSDFKISMVNEAACRATGLSRENLLQKTIHDFDPLFPTDEKGRKKTWEKIMTQRHFTHYGHLCNVHGACHPTEEQVSFLSSPDGDYVVVISQDITERMSQERKLKQNAAELIRAKDMAETANRLKSEFLSNMSHEIRTPMNAIIGYSEMLTQANLTDREKEYVQTIIKSGKSLILIINDILDLSKIEAGRLKIHKQSVDAVLFFKNIGSMFSERAAGKGISLQVDIDQNIPSPLIFDETRLRQVLFNLLGNAVTFTDQGQVNLRVRHQVLSDQEISLAIAVEDSGIGIPYTDQKTLFEPFRKGSADQARNNGSSGLGLALSQRLISLMGGTISLKSTPGKGSSFEILLPTVEVTANAPVSPPPPGPGRLTFLGGHLLVVDDVQINCRLITDFFRTSSVKISSAANGKEALELIRKEKPDLILMDLKMPIMDGYEATTIIKQDPDLADIPVVAVSASVLDFDNKDGLFDGSLTKPFHIKDLEREMTRFLKYDSASPAADSAVPEKKEAPQALPENVVNKIQAILSRHDKKSGNLSDAIQLGREIEQLGQDESQPGLVRIGEKLWASAEKFDILTVEQLQAELHRYTEAGKNHAQ